MEMLKKRMAARGEAGFTLIELLVVIAILAILAGVVVFAVGNSTSNAKVSSCKTELAAVKTAIAAARTANEVDGNSDDPGAYLDTASGNPKYYSWSGATSGTWTKSAMGTIPSGC